LKRIKKIFYFFESVYFITLVISVIIHLAFLPILIPILFHGNQNYDYTPVFIEKIPREISSTSEKEEEKEPDYNPLEKIPEGQVVDSPFALPQNLDKYKEPDHPKFLSDKTVRVKKETKSPMQVAGNYDVGSITAGPEELSGKGNTPGFISPSLEGRDKLKENEEGSVQKRNGSEGAEERPPGDSIQILPTFKTIAEAVKGSGIDNLEGVEEGDKTLINTIEWKYAGFFLRVRNLVAQYWNPAGAFLMYDPTGRTYGYKDRETIVRVVLDCDGSIKKLYVAHPSGAKFLDDEALNALRSAAPFSNPPKPLCDPENKIIVFNFGFFVKVGDKPIIRVKSSDF